MIKNKNLHLARHYEKMSDGVCRCRLCPRECKVVAGKTGVCKTRLNVDGELYAVNYELSLELTKEVIEAEAIYFRDPGVPILSVGNVGCNMMCDF